MGAIGFDGGKGLWDACRACSSRSLNRWAKQRNCEHAACARGLTRSATFVSGSLRLGNERHSVGWSCRESGTAGRDDTDWCAAHSPFFVAAREMPRTATHVEFCSDRPFGRGFDSRRLHYLIRGLRPRTPFSLTRTIWLLGNGSQPDCAPFARLVRYRSLAACRGLRPRTPSKPARRSW